MQKVERFSNFVQYGKISFFRSVFKHRLCSCKAINTNYAFSAHVRTSHAFHLALTFFFCPNTVIQDRKHFRGGEAELAENIKHRLHSLQAASVKWHHNIKCLIVDSRTLINILIWSWCSLCLLRLVIQGEQ